MNCEEFELIALDLEQSGASGEERAAAREHLRNCARCAGLADSWEEARTELFLLGDNTRQAEAPPRVEMRLRQEFRASRRPVVMRRRIATAAAWALAAAAVVAAGLTWNNWRQSRKEVAVRHDALIPAATDSSTENILLADNDGGSFTLLPGSIPEEAESASVMQVRMQRGALGAFGLPVDQGRVSDWIQVDLLVGEDGIPEAIRLHQDAIQAASVQ